jgi:hypothetical protein
MQKTCGSGVCVRCKFVVGGLVEVDFFWSRDFGRLIRNLVIVCSAYGILVRSIILLAEIDPDPERQRELLCFVRSTQTMSQISYLCSRLRHP